MPGHIQELGHAHMCGDTRGALPRGGRPAHSQATTHTYTIRSLRSHTYPPPPHSLCLGPTKPYPSDFFFMAGTISVSMSTFRSNFRVKHSLLGS